MIYIAKGHSPSGTLVANSDRCGKQSRLPAASDFTE